jgi:hypothetical protein
MSDICHMTRKGNLPLDSMCSCVGMCKRSSSKYKEEAYFDPEKMEEAEITYWKETFPAQAESVGEFYLQKKQEELTKELVEYHGTRKMSEVGRPRNYNGLNELVDGHPLMRLPEQHAVTISERKHAELKNAKKLLFKNYRRMQELVTKYREANLPVDSSGMDFFDWVEQNLDWAVAMRELFKKGAE